MCQVRGQSECYVAREQLPALQQMSVQERSLMGCVQRQPDVRGVGTSSPTEDIITGTR